MSAEVSPCVPSWLEAAKGLLLENPDDQTMAFCLGPGLGLVRVKVHPSDATYSVATSTLANGSAAGGCFWTGLRDFAAVNALGPKFAKVTLPRNTPSASSGRSTRTTRRWTESVRSKALYRVFSTPGV